MSQDERIVKRMVALAIRPYVTNQRKFERLYRAAVVDVIEKDMEKSALRMLHIRHDIRLIQETIDDLRGGFEDATGKTDRP